MPDRAIYPLPSRKRGFPPPHTWFFDNPVTFIFSCRVTKHAFQNNFSSPVAITLISFTLKLSTSNLLSATSFVNIRVIKRFRLKKWKSPFRYISFFLGIFRGEAAEIFSALFLPLRAKMLIIFKKLFYLLLMKYGKFAFKCRQSVIVERYTDWK